MRSTIDLQEAQRVGQEHLMGLLRTGHAVPAAPLVGGLALLGAAGVGLYYMIRSAKPETGARRKK